MKKRRSSVINIRKSRGNRATVFDLRARINEDVVNEERVVFIKILRSAYHRLIDHGEIEQRGFIVHSLFRSLEFASDAANLGLPLSDWNALLVAFDSFTRPAEHFMFKLFDMKRRLKNKEFNVDFDHDFALVQQRVRLILSFVNAHKWARQVFKEEFSKAGQYDLTVAEKVVMDESDGQVAMADKALLELAEEDVAIVKSHYVCHILLNKGAYYYKKLKKHGLVTEREAGEKLEEIEDEIYHVLKCRKLVHADELNPATKNQRLSLCPTNMATTPLHDDVGEETFKHSIHSSEGEQ